MEVLWIAIAGIAGVLVGGWLDRRRDRWRWRMDGRWRSYSYLIQSLDAFRHACYAYVAAALDPSDRGDEIEALFKQVERYQRELQGALRENSIFGSPRMRKVGEMVGESSMEALLTREPSEFVKAWDSPDDVGVFGGLAYVFLEAADAALTVARS